MPMVSSLQTLESNSAQKLW